MRKGIILLLTLAILIAALPVAAHAEETKIALGAGALVDGAPVWFGCYGIYPVLWRVMGAGNDGGNSKLLLSEFIIETSVQFDENGSSNVWQGSTAQEWCADFYANYLSRGEQAALVRTSKDDAEFCDDPGIFGQFYSTSRLEDEYVFFLSAQEAGEVYFPSKYPERRIAYARGREYESLWWLRSPAEVVYDNFSGVVLEYGELYKFEVNTSLGARPAFNLNLSSVLFTSFVSAYYDGYKLTLLDRELTIAPKTPTRDGSVITVPFTLGGDAAADDTKVYALVTDKAYTESGAKVLQYTALAVNGDGAGIFTLDTDAVTGTWGADYHVYLLAVNEGFELQTDYASAPVELREPAPHREPEDAFHMSKDAKAKMKVKDRLQIVVDGYEVKKYETSDAKVAKVTKNGLVKAVGAGKARITITTTEKLKKGKYKQLVLTVKVTDPNAPSKVSIAQGDKAKLRVGEKLKLTAAVKPEKAKTNLTWTSSDRSVATVSDKGVVKARQPGKADITVTTDNGKSATIRIRVKEKK